MSYLVLTSNDKQEWNLFLSRLPLNQQDIYFTSEYYAVYEKCGYGNACCFVFEQNGEIILYPFLKNSINSLGYNLNKEYFDIQGAYGYNGIVSSSRDKIFIEGFLQCLENYCIQENIVSEFTRLHPLLKNEICFSGSEVHFNQNNVFVDLYLKDFKFESYEHSVRKNLKKAARNALKCIGITGQEINENQIEEFIRIYYNTLERNHAEQFYYFSKEYFKILTKSLARNCKLYFIEYNEKLISTEIVLFGQEIGYSFLGGTLDGFFDIRPNDFLKDAIINDLKQLGLHYFCLGGGSQGVFKYKSTFAKNGIIPFYVGKWIHNQSIYCDIINQWKTLFPKSFESNKHMLLGYRNI